MLLVKSSGWARCYLGVNVHLIEREFQRLTLKLLGLWRVRLETLPPQRPRKRYVSLPWFDYSDRIRSMPVLL